MPDQSHPIADQFSDEEMEQMKRHGAAQLGGTQFSDEVEKHLRRFARERNAKKMKAAQTSGGAEGLGPSQIQTQQADQASALQQENASQGTAKNLEAQAQKIPVEAPSAPGPSGAGATKPFPAQAGPQPAAPAAPPPPEAPDEESPPEDGEE